MKKLQCTKCGQVFWMELEVNETLVGSGEWMKSPCPKCGAEWATVEPVVKRPKGVRRRKARPTLRRRVRPKKTAQPVEKKSAGFPPARMRSMRKRLGISQKELASFVGVNRGTVAFWEMAKFKPKEEKIVQLESLAKMGKGEVSKLFPAKTLHSGEKKAEGVKAENFKDKGQINRGKGFPKATRKAGK